MALHFEHFFRVCTYINILENRCKHWPALLTRATCYLKWAGTRVWVWLESSALASSASSAR